MRILVTGGAGLLGSNIIRALIKENHQPVCMIRESTDISALHGLGCDFVYGSVENQDEVEKAVYNCDAIVHAAAIYTHPKNDYNAFYRVNIQGTENMVKAALKYKLKKFIFISTANTIAPGSKRYPGIELHEFDSFHVGSHYLNSKYIAEQYILEQVERTELDAVIIHPSFMLGAYDSKPSSGRMILFWKNHNPVLVPPGGKNFVHVQDVADVVTKALIKSDYGERYLVTGENLSYREFFELLSAQTGEKKIRINVPKFLFVFAAWISQTLKGKKAELNVSNAKILGRENYYNGLRARKAFDYQPRPVDLAVKDALEWFATDQKLTEEIGEPVKV